LINIKATLKLHPSAAWPHQKGPARQAGSAFRAPLFGLASKRCRYGQ